VLLVVLHLVRQVLGVLEEPTAVVLVAALAGALAEVEAD
jgi:hypothetical protein